jgi:hypothetical protein
MIMPSFLENVVRADTLLAAICVASDSWNHLIKWKKGRDDSDGYGYGDTDGYRYREAEEEGGYSMGAQMCPNRHAQRVLPPSGPS